MPNISPRGAKRNPFVAEISQSQPKSAKASQSQPKSAKVSQSQPKSTDKLGNVA